MNLTYLAAPVLGAVIGYITNDIAIRMLFRPLKPIYIGRFRLPFTPGMIPKEQSRIAKAVAHTISADLLDEAALRRALLSEEMLQRVDAAATQLSERIVASESSPRELLYKYSDAEKIDIALDSLEQRAAEFVCQRLYEARISEALTDMIADKVRRKMPFLPAAMIAPVQEQIVIWLNEMLMKQCPPLIYEVIDREADALLDTSIGELTASHADKLQALCAKARGVYAQAIDAALPKILAAVDIEKIIETKISEFSPAELEKLLRALMKKELSAIIWLGSLLGFLMGWINLLFL